MKSSKQVRFAKSRSSGTADQTRREAGAAAVEFALVLPLLLALIFGMVNFGFIFAAQISLNSAARDAARAGVVSPLSGDPKLCSTIAQSARDGALTIGVDTTTINVTVTGPDGTCHLPAQTDDKPSSKVCTQPATPPTPPAIPVTQLTVVLSYTANSPVPYVPPSSATLTATGVFQCEYL